MHLHISDKEVAVTVAAEVAVTVAVVADINAPHESPFFDSTNFL